MTLQIGHEINPYDRVAQVGRYNDKPMRSLVGGNIMALSLKTGTGTVWGHLGAAFVSTLTIKSYVAPLVRVLPD